MKYYEERPESEKKYPCDPIRYDLKRCLLESDCVTISKKTPRECLTKRDPSVREECFQLYQLLFECKRALLDKRQRFRGRHGSDYK